MDIETTIRLLERRAKDAKRQREKRAAIKNITMAMQTPPTWIMDAMPPAPPKATKAMEAMKGIDTKTIKWITKDAKAIRREKDAKKEAKKDADADAKDADEFFGPRTTATISRFV